MRICSALRGLLVSSLHGKTVCPECRDVPDLLGACSLVFNPRGSSWGSIFEYLAEMKITVECDELMKRKDLRGTVHRKGRSDEGHDTGRL